jgi:meiotically up-regulated gene 157 (Mug157) protein
LRAHYAHGAVKDPVRQADQQLYPLLELVDHRRLTGAWPRPPATIASGPSWWGAQVAAGWQQLPRHAATGMLAAAENPADDPLELPLLVSTQILWWYTAVWLSSFAAEIGLDPDVFRADAEHVRTAIDAVFSADAAFGPMWAYAADGSRTSAPYADANDLPLALAPLWGLCTVDDPRWVATMRFAFSPHNPGYSSGAFGGLGSHHTPGTWPLGDLQEWIAASLLGEPARVRQVLQRVDRVASPDGMLPESYDPHTAEWRARHWFAWPGAAFGVIAAVAGGTLALAAPGTGRPGLLR